MDVDFFKKESERCLTCTDPHCKQACPIKVDIPKVLSLVKEGNYHQAAQTVGHPFGEICGYVCPHEKQCYGNCVLGKVGGAIDFPKAERELFETFPFELERTSNGMHGLSVAVVGGGVTGLTFASLCYARGADVTVYEKDCLLSVVKLIPEFRLPRKVIERAERAVSKLNVVKRNVDRNFLDYLIDNNDAVYLAVGRGKRYTLGVTGEEYAVDYEDFLKDAMQMEADGKVVVIGGGNTAIDCARKAVRSGAKATVAYRRTRDDMPAFDKEIAAAYDEGVEFIYNVAPSALSKQNGKLTLTLAKTESQGRGKLTVTDELTDVICNVAVSAAGAGFDNIWRATPVNGEPCVITASGRKAYIGGDASGGNSVANAVADAFKVVDFIEKK